MVRPGVNVALALSEGVGSFASTMNLLSLGCGPAAAGRDCVRRSTEGLGAALAAADCDD